MKRRVPAPVVHRIRVRNVDRQTVESLYLELRRLARTFGAHVLQFRVSESGRRRSA
jgi:hypothetical protein